MDYWRYHSAWRTSAKFRYIYENFYLIASKLLSSSFSMESYFLFYNISSYDIINVFIVIKTRGIITNMVELVVILNYISSCHRDTFKIKISISHILIDVTFIRLLHFAHLYCPDILKRFIVLIYRRYSLLSLNRCICCQWSCNIFNPSLAHRHPIIILTFIFQI